MKRKISLLLTLLLLLSFVVPMTAFAADDGTPVASHASLTTYEGATINVTLTSSWVNDKSGEIRYTTDGSEPTTKSTLYSGPITITKTTTLKAVAFTTLFTKINSPTMTHTYTVVDATPVANLKSGNYSAAQSVTLTTKFTSGSIFYTTDGSKPEPGKGTTKKYEDPIAISSTTHLRAITTWVGKQVNNELNELYTFSKGACADPQINPNGGTFDKPVTVTLTCTTPGAAIWYFLGDYDPLLEDDAIKYTGPFTLSESVTLRVASTANDHSPGSSSATFIINTTKATAPVASPKGGTYNTPQTVTLTSATPGATIWYRTDGKNPTGAAAELYAGPFTVSADAVVRAVAGKAGLINSDVMTETYVISQSSGSMDNFLVKNTYKSGMFTDVNENLWYGFNQQKVIVRAYEYGLMKGTTATTFNPEGNFTIAEAITVAARVHSIYMTGSEDFVQGSPWYQVYIDYAVANGIVKSDDFSKYNVAATRAQMAYIFSKALPLSCYPDRMPLTVKTPPDVNTSTPYQSSILSLYEAGILGGSDDKGTFNPSANIKRSEVSAITSRLILFSMRLGVEFMPS